MSVTLLRCACRFGQSKALPTCRCIVEITGRLPPVVADGSPTYEVCTCYDVPAYGVVVVSGTPRHDRCGRVFSRHRGSREFNTAWKPRPAVTGRNSRCHCGSGRKFKRCCGR